MNNQTNRKVYEFNVIPRKLDSSQFKPRNPHEGFDHQQNPASNSFMDEIERKPQKLLKKDEDYAQEQQNFLENIPDSNFERMQGPNQLLREYDQRNIKYCCEDYSHLSNLLLQRFSKQDSAQEISAHYPLFQILRAIVKKFMLNELEIIFYLHMIEETKWNYKDNLIADFVTHFNQDFLPIVASEVKNMEEFSKLLIYLVFCAFTMKNYLNENSDVNLINAHISNFMKIEQFQKQIEAWKSKNMQGSIKIGPRILNKFFNKLSRTPRDQRIPNEDYNALVDSIIQISPPYNSEKTQKQEPLVQQQLQPEKPPQPQMVQSYGHVARLQEIPSYTNYMIPGSGSIFNTNPNQNLLKMSSQFLYQGSESDFQMQMPTNEDLLQTSIFQSAHMSHHPQNSPSHHQKQSKISLKQQEKKEETIDRIKQEDAADNPNLPPLTMLRGVSTTFIKE